MADIKLIKQLRKATGASIINCKAALEQAEGDFKGAKATLEKQGLAFAAKRATRQTREGIIESYIHQNQKIGVLIELNCETDFVAKSEDFQKLAHELCLQIAAMDPEKDALLSQSWIKDETKTVKDLIASYIVRLGENITVNKFIRYEI